MITKDNFKDALFSLGFKEVKNGEAYNLRVSTKWTEYRRFLAEKH